MRILGIIKELDYSGAPKMMAWLLNHLIIQENEVYLLALYSNKIDQELDDRIVFLSFEEVNSNSRFVRNTIKMIKLIKKEKELIDKIKPDCVISFLDSTGYYLAFMNKILWKKRACIVVSERSDPYSHGIISRHVKAFLIQYADAIVFQTEGAKMFYNKKIRSISVVIPNPALTVANNEIIDYAKRKNRIVTVGRLYIKQKRQDVLIDAFRIINDSHPDTELYIIGDGEDKKVIEEYIKKTGTKNVYLTGKVENTIETIKNSRVFVLTSDYEGMPNALIEAMTVGLPCVSTDCRPGGASFLIRNGENGYIVPRANYKELAKCICSILENEDLANSFSYEAVKIREMISEDYVAEKWKELLCNVVANNERKEY